MTWTGDVTVAGSAARVPPGTDGLKGSRYDVEFSWDGAQWRRLKGRGVPGDLTRSDAIALAERLAARRQREWPKYRAVGWIVTSRGRGIGRTGHEVEMETSEFRKGPVL